MHDAIENTAAVLIIGDEILSGRTQDTNLATIARFLTELGIQLGAARVVRDVEAEIVQALNRLRASHQYVFTTGGIGPTHDDITADAVAKAFGVGISIRDDALAILENHYPPGMLNDARRRMARIPDGASLIENPVSKAPGFQIENVFVLAGVPAVMKAMLEGVRGRLSSGPAMLSRTISTYLAEGGIAAELGAIQGRHADISIGSYPFFRAGRIGTSLVCRGRDAGKLDLVAGEVTAMILAMGAEAIDGSPPDILT